MADDGLSQDPHRLRIDTALNAIEKDKKGDPFLLMKVHGIEDFSQPYKYEISMLRDLNKPRLNPADLINTIAKIGIRISEIKLGRIPIIRPEISGEVGHSFITRFGVFENITDEGKSDDADDYRVYSATIVPAFKMMDREIVFRVFEKKNVLDIIREVTKFFPNLAIDLRLLDKEKPGTFPIMEYCVQFRESSFNFLSRLMAQFGIWYFFEHDEFSIGNSRMVLGRSTRHFEPCKIEQGDLKGKPVDGLVLRPKKPSLLTITQFRRVYTPTQRLARSGNFNILVPFSTIQAKSAIHPDHDLIAPPKSETKSAGALPTDSERFRTEIFPADVRVQPEAQQDADVRLLNTEGQVFTASGNTRNAAFIVGRKFHIAKKLALPQEPGRPDIVDQVLGHDDKFVGLDFDPQIPEDPEFAKKRTFLLVHLEFMGGEPFYSKKGFVESVFGQAFDPNDKGPDAFGDLLLGFTSQGMNNYLQNEFPYEMQNAWYPETQKPGNQNQSVPYFLPFVLGGGFAAITGLFPALKTAFTDLFRSETMKSDYTNSFQAVPLDENAENAAQLPPPLPSGWVKPIANGPHLALVIGPNGVAEGPQLPQSRKLDKENIDIFADKLGRVRVRFPWDRQADEAPDNQFKRGDNTCWVRVSEGWAGRGFGTQFLPRIGQEVIVDFIDGDPDRPIITGRVYNADHTKTNLPFPGGEGGAQDVKPDDLLNSVALTDHDFRLSGLKTRSIPSLDPTTGAPLPERFHLLRLNDDRNKEQYLIRSQRRLDITAFEKRYESIGSDRHLTVGKVGGTQSTSSEAAGSGGGGGSYLAMVTDEYHLSVGKTRKTLVKKDDNLQVNGSSTELVGSSWSVTVGGPAAAAAIQAVASVGSGATAAEEGQIEAAATLQALAALAQPTQATIDVPSALGNLVLNAGFSMTLNVGSSSIVLTPAAIFIQAAAINLVGTVLGAPPVPTPVFFPPKLPTDAGAVKPKQPTLADTGDKITPPPET